MKTSLAIALAVAALTIGTATMAPISSTAVAGGGGPDKWCGAAVCPRGRHSQQRIVGRKLQ